MAKYQITSPTGDTFEVTAPDTATEQEVLAYAQSQFSAPPTPGVDVAKIAREDLPLQEAPLLGEVNRIATEGLKGLGVASTGGLQRGAEQITTGTLTTPTFKERAGRFIGETSSPQNLLLGEMLSPAVRPVTSGVTKLGGKILGGLGLGKKGLKAGGELAANSENVKLFRPEEYLKDIGATRGELLQEAGQVGLRPIQGALEEAAQGATRTSGAKQAIETGLKDLLERGVKREGEQTLTRNLPGFGRGAESVTKKVPLPPTKISAAEAQKVLSDLGEKAFDVTIQKGGKRELGLAEQAAQQALHSQVNPEIAKLTAKYAAQKAASPFFPWVGTPSILNFGLGSSPRAIGLAIKALAKAGKITASPRTLRAVLAGLGE